MRLFSPHKHVLFLAIVCILVVGGAFYYSKLRNSGVFNDPDLTTTPVIAIDYKNSGGDTDWRSQFVDISSSSITNVSNGSSTSSTPDSNREPTLTEKFGASFITHYVSLKQSGGLEDDEILKNSAEQIVSSGLYAESAPYYTKNELSISDDNSPVALAGYIKMVEASLNLYKHEKSEMTLTKEAYEKGDQTKLGDIAQIISTYDSIILSLLAIRVPSGLVDTHLSLVNSISTLKFVAQSLMVSLDDPMKGMIGINNYINGVQGLLSSLKELDEAMDYFGIEFHINTTLLSSLLNAKITE